MAVCWKVSWKLEPLPLSVPLRPPLPEEPVVVDELQAVIDKATAARAAPATTALCLRTRCISDIPSQLPAECCEEDGLDGARAVPAWPRMMLAAGPKPSPIASRPAVRPVCSIIFRTAVACGSWRPGGYCRSLTWGLSPPRRDHAALAVRAARGLPLLSCCSPIPAMHPPLSGALPGTTSADDDRSQSVIMDARPEAGQEYFDKCSLSCHLQFGLMLLQLSMRRWPLRNHARGKQ